MGVVFFDGIWRGTGLRQAVSGPGPECDGLERLGRDPVMVARTLRAGVCWTRVSSVRLPGDADGGPIPSRERILPCGEAQALGRTGRVTAWGAGRPVVRSSSRRDASGHCVAVRT